MFSALIIIANNDLALIKDDNIIQFYSLYVGWLDGVFDNVKSTTGHISKLDWMPE